MDGENQDIREMLLRQDTKFELIRTDITELKIQGAKQNEQLAEHIRRTAMAEENISMLREENEFSRVRMEAELRPIKNHVAMVGAFLKLMGILFTSSVTLGGILLGILKLLKGVG
jgi:hypothetical protein